MEEKIKWCLEHEFNPFHLSLITKAIMSDKISISDFIYGYHEIRNAQWDGEENHVPEVFSEL